MLSDRKRCGCTRHWRPPADGGPRSRVRQPTSATRLKPLSRQGSRPRRRRDARVECVRSRDGTPQLPQDRCGAAPDAAESSQGHRRTGRHARRLPCQPPDPQRRAHVARTRLRSAGCWRLRHVRHSLEGADRTMPRRTLESFNAAALRGPGGRPRPTGVDGGISERLNATRHREIGRHASASATAPASASTPHTALEAAPRCGSRPVRGGRMGSKPLQRSDLMRQQALPVPGLKPAVLHAQALHDAG